jgi:hypothetical protein
MPVMSPKRVSGMYLKPVIGASKADPMSVLKKLTSELHKRIKAKIEETAFSSRAKAAFSRAFTIKINSRSITIYTSHPGFLPMLRGQKKGQMTWLVKARAPIPIITDEGKLIFRSATPKSMADGKWVHPGRAKNDFVSRAKKATRDFVRSHLTKAVAKQIRNALAGK